MSRRRIALLVIAVLAAGCGKPTPPGAPSAAARPAAAPAPPPLDVVKTVAPRWVTRPATLETSGKVQFNEETLVRVHAPATGRVLEVFARPGDAVEPGQRLFVLDSPDLGSAKSDYAKAVADADRADAALKLAKDLFGVKAIAEKELRDADSDLRKAVAERERAAARLLTLGLGRDALRDIAARTDTGTTITVRAPRSGIVVERNVSPGQVVSYGASDTPVNLFTIADLSTMWVVADVYEPDIPRVRRGERLVVTLPCCPDERYEGAIGYISDSVDPQTRTVKVRAVVPNRGRALKNEMFVKATLATGTARVLVVPQSAVHRENGQTFVVVAQGPETYERRPVTLGGDVGPDVEVRAGVTPEDHVVSEGSILVKKAARAGGA
jgi:cobalt-zinc-cadmium efflux system membrane fusion protein